MIACSTCGREAADEAKFCTACGTPLSEQTAPSGSTPDTPAETPGGPPVAESTPTVDVPAGPPVAESTPTVDVPAGPPVAESTPTVDVPAGPPTVPPATPPEVAAGEPSAPKRPRRWKKPLAIAAVVLVVAAGGAFAATQLLGDDESGGPNERLVYYRSASDNSGDSEFLYAPYGSDDPPAEYWDGEFDPALLLRPGTPSGADVQVAGGPLIGVGSEDGENSVIVVDTASGDVEELFASDDFLISAYSPANDRVYVEEIGDGNTRCYAGAPDSTLERIVREDECGFSSTGDYALSLERNDDGEVDYEVLQLDGTVVARGATWSRPVFSEDDGFVVVEVGGEDSRSVSIIELPSGTVVAESARGDAVELLDIADDQILVGIDAEGVAQIEVVSVAGPADRVFEHEGSVAGAFLRDQRDRIVVSAAEPNGVAAFILTPSDSGAYDQTRIANDVISATVPPYTGERRPYVIVSQEEGEEDALALVRTDKNTVELDLDALVSHSSWTVPDGSAVWVQYRNLDGEETLTRIDSETDQTTDVVEAWSQLRVNEIADDGAVLISGFEDPNDDEEVVAVIDADGRIEFIDEANVIGRAHFSPDERTVIFTVSDGDDIEVRSYELNSRTSPQLLARDVSLTAVGWSGPGLVDFANMRTLGVATTASPDVTASTARCSTAAPGLDPLVPTGSVFGDLNGETMFCLEIERDGFYTIVVESDAFDSTLEIVSIVLADPEQPTFSQFNDDFNGLDAGISEFLAAGAYQLSIGSFGGNSGPFTLTATQG